MKSPLFCMSHPAGRAVTSAPHSPSGCPWHSGVCDKGQAGAAGGARPSTAAWSGLLCGMPPVSSCRSSVFPACRQANPLLESPAGAEALPAVTTCASHAGTRHMLQTPFSLTALALHLSQDKEGAAAFQVCFETTIRALYGFKITILQYWQTITSSRKAAL